MITVTNIIEQVKDHKSQPRPWKEVEGIMLHRCGVDLVYGHVLGYDAVSVVEAFIGRRPEWKAVAGATGCQNAYSILVGSDLGPTEYDGRAWQALPLTEIGWHGRRFSDDYVGLAWIADPRKVPLSGKAWSAMAEICAALCLDRGWDPYQAVLGHGEVEGSHDGSKAPGQPSACPGLSQRDLNVFRDDVAVAMRYHGLQSVKQLGLVVGV